MLFKDCPIGSIVSIDCEGETVTGTIIYKEHPHNEYTLLGWKTNPPYRYFYAWHKSTSISSIQDALNEAGMNYGFWFSNDNLISSCDTSSITFTGQISPTIRHGMSCDRCQDFNAYAEPNQSNGKHRCYRCRK